MSSIIVSKYLTQDFSLKEKESYEQYIKGDSNCIIWIKKASIRREHPLLLELKCEQCSNYVNIRENGLCTCKEGHLCYDIVISTIQIIKKNENKS